MHAWKNRIRFKVFNPMFILTKSTYYHMGWELSHAVSVVSQYTYVRGRSRDAIKLQLDAGGKSACGREREINVANHKHVVWVWVWEESLIGRGDKATGIHTIPILIYMSSFPPRDPYKNKSSIHLPWM